MKANEYHAHVGHDLCRQRIEGQEAICGKSLDHELHRQISDIVEDVDFLLFMDGWTTGYANSLIQGLQMLGVKLPDPIMVHRRAAGEGWTMLQDPDIVREIMTAVRYRQELAARGEKMSFETDGATHYTDFNPRGTNQ